MICLSNAISFAPVSTTFVCFLLEKWNWSNTIFCLNDNWIRWFRWPADVDGSLGSYSELVFLILLQVSNSKFFCWDLRSSSVALHPLFTRKFACFHNVADNFTSTIMLWSCPYKGHSAPRDINNFRFSRWICKLTLFVRCNSK